MAVKYFKDCSLEASDEQEEEEVSFMDFTSLKDFFNFLEIDLDRPYENQMFFSELATLPEMEIFSCRLPREVLQFLENPTCSGANLPKYFAPLCYVHESDEVWEVRQISSLHKLQNYLKNTGYSKSVFLVCSTLPTICEHTKNPCQAPCLLSNLK